MEAKETKQMAGMETEPAAVTDTGRTEEIAYPP